MRNNSIDEKKEKVAAVIVTYNRKELLKECLAGILNQSRSIDAVFLIDNASTDGTPEFLEKEGFLLNSKIKYFRSPENTGSAGGFHEGLKRAYESGYDWFWLMDDDVKSLPDGLKKMLEYKDISLCIHPRKIYPDGKRQSWCEYLDIKTGRVFSNNDIYFEKYHKKFIEINFGCFEGMLIHKDIVEKIGYPDKIFFIKGDDTIYGFLASMYTNVLYVNEVAFVRLLRNESKKNIFGRESNRSSDMILYYSLRNNFLIEKYFQAITASWNQNKKINHKFLILLRALRSIGSTLIYDDHKLRRIGVIFRALIDGYRLSRSYAPSLNIEKS